MSLAGKLLDWFGRGRGAMSTLQAGQTAPDFRLELAGGATKSLDELLSEGPVLLAFYKVTCPTCQFTLPFLERLKSRAFSVFAVCQDDATRAREFEKEFSVHLPTLLDKARDGYPVSNAFGLTHVPSLFLVEQDKRISWASVGFFKRELETLAARAGKPIFQAGELVPEAKSG